MPGQRKEGKTKFGVWLTPEELESLRNLASFYGKNMSDLVKQLMMDAAKQKGIIPDDNQREGPRDDRNDQERKGNS